eukprot:SAG31_NODE_796_length_12032_cov_21.073242_15_plen_131_part_00
MKPQIKFQFGHRLFKNRFVWPLSAVPKAATGLMLENSIRMQNLAGALVFFPHLSKRVVLDRIRGIQQERSARFLRFLQKHKQFDVITTNMALVQAKHLKHLSPPQKFELGFPSVTITNHDRIRYLRYRQH